MDALGTLGLVLQLLRALPLRDVARAARGRPPLEAVVRPNAVIAGHYAWTAIRSELLPRSPTIDDLNAAAIRGSPIVPTTLVVAPRNTLGPSAGAIRLQELTFWLRDRAPTPELEEYALLVDTIPSAGPTARADAHIGLTFHHNLRQPVPLFRTLAAQGATERFVDIVPDQEYELALYPNATAPGLYTFDLLAECSYRGRIWHQPLRRGHQLLVVTDHDLARFSSIYQTYAGMSLSGVFDQGAELPQLLWDRTQHLQNIDNTPLAPGSSVRVTGAITPPESYQKKSRQNRGPTDAT